MSFGGIVLNFLCGIVNPVKMLRNLIQIFDIYTLNLNPMIFPGKNSLSFGTGLLNFLRSQNKQTSFFKDLKWSAVQLEKTLIL